jgi:hypothetical protein
VRQLHALLPVALKLNSVSSENFAPLKTFSSDIFFLIFSKDCVMNTVCGNFRTIYNTGPNLGTIIQGRKFISSSDRSSRLWDAPSFL